MINKTNISIAYVIISIIAIGVLIYLLVNHKKGHESFCSCRNMINRVCPDPQNQINLYNSGQLTENTDLSKVAGGPPGWKTIMPEDIYAAQLAGRPYAFQ